MDNKKHGIAKWFSAEDEKETYRIYENDKMIKELTDDEVKDINSEDIHSGKFIVEQMKVIYDNREKYGLHGTKRLDFEFIENQKHESMAIVDDLVYLAEKFGLDNHEPDQKVEKHIDELEKKRQVLLKKRDAIRAQFKN